MFTKLELFRTAHAMASHAGKRQAVIARNIANSDTPGFRAQDIKDFAETFRSDEAPGMRATRSGHMGQAGDASTIRTFTAATADTAPNGNSVSLETEMLKGVDAMRQHDRALAIYRSGLTILRSALGRR